LPPHSRSKKQAKQETSMKAGGKQSFHAGFFLGLLFELEDGEAIFLQNIS
jgi:hypothetical protein